MKTHETKIVLENVDVFKKKDSQERKKTHTSQNNDEITAENIFLCFDMDASRH